MALRLSRAVICSEPEIVLEKYSERYLYGGMIADWIVVCQKIMVSKVRSIATFKKYISEIRTEWYEISPYAIEEVHAFITSIPDEYRCIAMADSLRGLLHGLFRKKEITDNIPIWSMSTVTKRRGSILNVTDTVTCFRNIKELEKDLSTARRKIKIVHKRSGEDEVVRKEPIGRNRLVYEIPQAFDVFTEDAEAINMSNNTRDKLGVGTKILFAGIVLSNIWSPLPRAIVFRNRYRNRMRRLARINE